jgi:hypothetical protein
MRKRWKPRYEHFDVETTIDGIEYRGRATIKHGRPGIITVSYGGGSKTTAWFAHPFIAEALLFELVTERDRAEGGHG